MQTSCNVTHLFADHKECSLQLVMARKSKMLSTIARGQKGGTRENEGNGNQESKQCKVMNNLRGEKVTRNSLKNRTEKRKKESPLASCSSMWGFSPRRAVSQPGMPSKCQGLSVLHQGPARATGHPRS